MDKSICALSGDTKDVFFGANRGRHLVPRSDPRPGLTPPHVLLYGSNQNEISKFEKCFLLFTSSNYLASLKLGRLGTKIKRCA